MGSEAPLGLGQYTKISSDTVGAWVTGTIVVGPPRSEQKKIRFQNLKVVRCDRPWPNHFDSHALNWALVGPQLSAVGRRQLPNCHPNCMQIEERKDENFGKTAEMWKNYRTWALSWDLLPRLQNAGVNPTHKLHTSPYNKHLSGTGFPNNTAPASIAHKHTKKQYESLQGPGWALMLNCSCSSNKKNSKLII